MAQIHDRLEEWVNGDLAIMVLEPLMGLAVIAAFVAAARRLPPLSGTLLWAAAGTVVLALASSALNAATDPHLPYAGVVFLQTSEEVGEMLTAVLLLSAISAPAMAVLHALRPAEIEAIELPELEPADGTHAAAI
jgi:hypothetical protein